MAPESSSLWFVASAADMAEAERDMTACLERVREHDEGAARALINHLYPLVIKIVRAHRSRRHDEQDLAQMVFVKVFNHLDQFSGKVPLEHWVSRIAVNTCLNELRTEKSRPELRWADLSEIEAELLEKSISSDAAPASSDQLAARELVGKLLDTLSPADRLVITMIDLEERSVSEVRQRTGWSSSLVKVRAFRARRKLRKQLDKILAQERQLRQSKVRRAP